MLRRLKDRLSRERSQAVHDHVSTHDALNRSPVMINYLLTESVVKFERTVDHIIDRRIEDKVFEYDDKESSVVHVGLSVRGDNEWPRELKAPERGDTELTVELSPDQRIFAFGSKSVGVGGRVLTAGAKLIATIAGLAVRAIGTADATVPEPPSEEAAQAAWIKSHKHANDYRTKYGEIADKALKQAHAVREDALSAIDPSTLTSLLRRADQWANLAASAQKEVAKVDALYAAWSDNKRERTVTRHEYTLSVDELPVHKDPSQLRPDVDQAQASAGLLARWETLWNDFGVRVEISTVRPPDDQSTVNPGPNGLQWRIPRPARVWVWRRGQSDGVADAVLELTYETLIVDSSSRARTLMMPERLFGESSGELKFDDNGVPTKFVLTTKSAAGSFADALGGVPDALVAGTTAASTISTTLGGLADAGAERRLAAVKRQVDLRTKQLELEGLTATASDFAELKRLEQQVAIAAAMKTLAPQSHLADIQAQLTLENTERELENAIRQRASDNELAAARQEITRLTTELELSEARLKRAGGNGPRPA